MPDASSSVEAPVSNPSSPPRLKRVLGLGDLIFYGVVLIQPVGAIGIFGLAEQKSFGHVTLTIVIALVAMMLTAMSYGRMAGLYPAAGSAYAYVGRSLHPNAGFLAGWAMFLDYLVIPIVSVVYGALSMQKMFDLLAPELNHRIIVSLNSPFDERRTTFILWVIIFVVIATILNIRGMKWTALANQILTAAMFLVILLFVFDCVRYLLGRGGFGALISYQPLYNFKTFNFAAVATATSLAALTYIGFDGITTLSEDVKEPKKTVPLSVVLVCVVIGVCAIVEMYLAHMVWPDYTTFKDPDTAFFEVCVKVGGPVLFHSMTLIMAVACLGSALTGQVGAARILFGMGRDNALPRFFARLDKRNNPAVNIWLIGVVSLTGALLLDYEKAATLINFGAFLAFLGVNLAVIREFVFRPPVDHKRNWFLDLFVPAAAFAFCFWIWLFLPVPAKKLGGIWCEAGLLWMAVRTFGVHSLFSFRSRINRGAFWLISAALPGIVILSWALYPAVLAAFQLLAHLNTNKSSFVGVARASVLLLALLVGWIIYIWLALATFAKRCHDRDKSGAMILIALIPAIGAVWALIELGILKGTHGPNRFGDRPLQGKKCEITAWASC